MSLTIRPDFLSPQAPPNVTSSIIDFNSTTPRIRAYKRNFAAVIDNFMTEAECNELLALAEKSAALSSDNKIQTPIWERAMINVGGGKQAMATDVRNCGRIIFDSTELADRLLARLIPFFRRWDMERLENRMAVTGLTGRQNTYYLTRLNERLRFLKYVGGEYFRPHWDGRYITPDRGEVSFYTVHFYLNGEGESGQDLKEVLRREKEERKWGCDGEVGDSEEERGKGRLLGGATSFIPSWEEDDQAVRVWPKTGRVLVFQHNDLLHGGDSVYGGTKYTVRTDVMYSKTNPLSQASAKS
ncbi:hypothetical protein BGW36DRAFT_460032 [Talaromyces proteolyticus]|uniref:Prolyl 4-hydroxylase alpha subunit domain-containing protein n=1 Tax=Talaromyces proteolyticus TaxID=1131652 RepID=A0AAD4Q317_9EURO|nr:uncharacterized protein BGW36DRAFT_460032 [Talaromyces proteolyticus]KAH8700956.1 hypothetical protein BGW36DRAFT_460032 [Talaromyces proteolyticus]